MPKIAEVPSYECACTAKCRLPRREARQYKSPQLLITPIIRARIKQTPKTIWVRGRSEDIEISTNYRGSA